MKNKSKLNLLALCLGLSSASHAAALAMDKASPFTMQDVLGSVAFAKFGTDYDFYFDSVNPKVIYYLSKYGGIVNYRGFPKLSISAITPRNQFMRKIFEGKSAFKITGTFQTIPNHESHQEIIQIADQNGFTLRPMYAENASLLFSVESDVLDANGYPKVTCQNQDLESGLDITVDDGAFKVPNIECVYQTFSKNGTHEIVERKVPILYKAYVSNINGHGSTNRVLDFFLEYVPDNAVIDDYQQGVNNGSNSGVIKATVHWDLKTARQSSRAHVKIDWHQSIQAFSTYVAEHDYVCTDLQLRKYTKKVIEEGAMVVQMYNVHTKKWDEYDSLSSKLGGAIFDQIVNLVISHLFTRIEAKTDQAAQSQLDIMDGSGSKTLFVFHTNYEKVLSQRYESYSVLISHQKEKNTSKTWIHLSCVKGGFGERVVWDEACNR